MSTLSPEQIARHAYDAGFRGDDLAIAVAVALAESTGDPRAHNPVPPDNSYGLWQINMIGALGPERRRQYGLDANRDLFDPAVNAKVANKISSDGNNWTPWSTYTNGAYRRHLDRAERAARAVTERRGNGGGRPDRNPGGGGGGGGNGFTVDTGVLGSYVRTTRRVADDLTGLGRQHLRKVGQIADDSFGRIGKETGFAAALDHFGAALHRQVRGVSANADALAKSASRTAKAYRNRDDEIAAEFNRM